MRANNFIVVAATIVAVAALTGTIFTTVNSATTQSATILHAVASTPSPAREAHRPLIIPHVEIFGVPDEELPEGFARYRVFIYFSDEEEVPTHVRFRIVGTRRVPPEWLGDIKVTGSLWLALKKSGEAEWLVAWEVVKQFMKRFGRKTFRLTRNELSSLAGESIYSFEIVLLEREGATLELTEVRTTYGEKVHQRRSLPDDLHGFAIPGPDGYEWEFEEAKEDFIQSTVEFEELAKTNVVISGFPGSILTLAQASVAGKVSSSSLAIDPGDCPCNFEGELVLSEIEALPDYYSTKLSPGAARNLACVIYISMVKEYPAWMADEMPTFYLVNTLQERATGKHYCGLFTGDGIYIAAARQHNCNAVGTFHHEIGHLLHRQAGRFGGDRLDAEKWVEQNEFEYGSDELPNSLRGLKKSGFPSRYGASSLAEDVACSYEMLLVDGLSAFDTPRLEQKARLLTEFLSSIDPVAFAQEGSSTPNTGLSVDGN